MSVNFRTLDLNLLRVFAAVMVERNVTRAASQLAMTQPAVSNALRRLREAAGDELFVTVPSGVLPTAHAEALWPDIRFALDRLRHVLDPQGFDPARDGRGFTLAMADATATVLMPAFMAALAREDARAEVRVLPLTSRDPRAQLEHGAADAAVGFFPDVAVSLAAEGTRSTIVLEPLYSCEYVCVMRREHALGREPVLTLDAYCWASHVRVNFAGRPRGFVDEALAIAGRERRVALTVNQFSTAARVVHDSDLIAVLPRSFVPASGLAEGLVVHRFPGVLPTIEVSLLWHRRHERDAAQRWWRATFATAARSLRIGVASATPDAGHDGAIADDAAPVPARAVARQD
jgi:DNA-binding transcriptional LysR family regulator